MFIGTVMAAEPASDAAGAASGYSSLIMMALFAIVFYFLLIRPQSKRQKEHKSMLDSIEKGDEVVTNGGILGKVTKITEGFIVLNVANNVEMKFQKHAVTATLPKGTIKAVNE
jgi:preprotein translocase subunit YajC